MTSNINFNFIKYRKKLNRIITYDSIQSLYEGRIATNSIICTDSHKSDIQFAKDLELDHKK